MSRMSNNPFHLLSELGHDDRRGSQGGRQRGQRCRRKQPPSDERTNLSDNQLALALARDCAVSQSVLAAGDLYVQDTEQQVADQTGSTAANLDNIQPWCLLCCELIKV